MVTLFFVFLVHYVDCIWDEVQGPFKYFLGFYQNNAEDYLDNGVHWYQLGVLLHGIYYYIPLSIASQKQYNDIKDHDRFIWTFTLPIGDIKTEKSQKRRDNAELTAAYGGPHKAYRYGISSISIVLEEEKYSATINGVYATKFYSGSEIMAIFMSILIKHNLEMTHIIVTDTSLKCCHKSGANIPHSIFMAFLGRLDFFREFGFYAMKELSPGYEPDIQKQAEYDAAARRLRDLRIVDVFRAAIHDNIKNLSFVNDLTYYLIGQNNTTEIKMSDYLKPFYSDWENQCDKYMQTMKGLNNIPTIRRQYFDRIKHGKIRLVWVKSQLDALNARLKAIQE